MKLKIALFLILVSVLLFFGPSPAKSEEEILLTVTGRAEKRQNIRENAKVTLEAEREAKKIEMEKNKEEIKLKREAFKETLQTEREERKTKIAEMRETFKEKREDFKEKIKTIKDERKKQLTEKIDNRMSTVNKNQTSRMTGALGRLTEHINKLEERVVKAKTEGIDVSEVETSIATAKNSISVALAAVEEQAAKDYAFEIVDEENLGQSVKSSFDLLSQDLKGVQELLVKAKEDVVNAYKLAKALKK